MTHIHYKFSSKLSYDTVVFDGPHTTLSDLKRQIMGKEKLRAGDCDLQITNAQTKEEYTDDDSLISKGSSVIVRRIPIIGGKSSSSHKTHKLERSDVHLPHAFGASRAMNNQTSSNALSFFSKMQMANLVDADVSEEDKIKVMMNQSAYDSMNLDKKFGTSLPGNYTCYRCGTSGHHIRNCPIIEQEKNAEALPRIKKSTGIPRSFMVEVDDPSIKGAMLTKCGRYAIPAIDAEAYAIGKKEKPPFIGQEQQKPESVEDPIPDELLCVICQDLLCDAVVIPCCGNSYCDDCIRTTLLDSEDHVCPTCSQSDVSPDTLIANKFLRQAVNNFKKERGYTNSYKSKVAASQSQSSNPTPNPIPTPPPLTRQSLLPKPHLSPYRQQDSTVVHPKAEETPPVAQLPVALPVAACSAAANNAPTISAQSVQIDQEILNKEAEKETHSDSAAGSLSPLASSKDPTAAPSQPIPLVNHNSDAEQLQTVSVNPQLSSGSASQQSVSACLDRSGSFSSLAGLPADGRNESNTQLLPPLSSPVSFSVIPPPLFPPVFRTFPPTHQANCSYPPGYLPPTPIWTPATLQSSPIPSLCSSTSSIHVSNEWYGHQGSTKKRSPHGGLSNRRSSSNSNSKSAKSMSSHSYSRSSSRSRSRSRSRSQGRSRPRSPYSHRKDFQSRSHPSSHSYGYKRSHSPTPSSSSSPQGGHMSRSKSPTDQWRNHHHSKKSSLSSCNSKRRAERDTGGSATTVYTENRNQCSSMEMDRERYLQWKKEYTEWCEKYFSSYVGQFHQLPVPPFLTVPPVCPQWEDREGWRFYSHGSDSRYRAQDRHTSRRDDRSPSSESSSYSRSSPSRSSSDSYSTSSQSPSNSRSSPSHRAKKRCSPLSRSSSDDSSTPSHNRAQTRSHPESKSENCSQQPVKLMKEREDEHLEAPCRDEKQPRSKTVKEFYPLMQKEQRIEKEVIKGEWLSSPAEAVSEVESLKEKKKKRNPKLPASLSNTPVQEGLTPHDATESLPRVLKRDEILGKHRESKVKEEKNSERERARRRGKDSHSGRVTDRHNKATPRKQLDRVGTRREESPGRSRTSDSRSAKSSQRKRQEVGRHVRERSPAVKHANSKCQKAKTAEGHQSHDRQSPKPCVKEKKNTEKTTKPPTETAIWEGGIKVRLQKKISINICLDKKREDENTDQPDSSNLESMTDKPDKNTECADVEGEETVNQVPMVTEANKDAESSKDFKIQEPKPDAEENSLWHQMFLTDASGLMMDKTTTEDDNEEGLTSCDCSQAEQGENSVMKDCEAAARADIGHPERSMEETLKGREENIAEENSPEATREEDPHESTSQWTKVKTYHDDPISIVDASVNPAAESCGAEQSQEKKKNVKTVEKYSQDQAAHFPPLQVSRSKWEEENEEQQDGGEKRVYSDAPAVAQPHPSVTVSSRGTEGDNDHRRQGSREMEGEQDRVTVTGKDKEPRRSSSLSVTNRGVSPSSGKDETDSPLSTHRDPERERHRVRARRSEDERRERNGRERKRSKEHRREKDKERSREKKWERSSNSSTKKGKLSSSYSSTSHNKERSHRQREGSNRRASFVDEKPSRKRSAEASDQNPPKMFRDTSPAKKSQDSHHSHSSMDPQDASRTYRQQNRPTPSHHSLPSRSQCKDTDLLPFESSRKSPDWALIHNKSRI